MKEINASAFFYIDGIPTKGAWIDLDIITEWDEIKAELGKHLGIDADDIDEVLCADIEGIARHFYHSSSDIFDLTAWVEFREDLERSHLEVEVADAYLDNCGIDASVSDIEEAYSGEYESWGDFAYDLLEQTGDLELIPENLRTYFDFDKFGHDLSFDYFESNGHFFRNC